MSRARIDVEIAQHAHHHIALRMVARLGLADTAGVDEMLHVAVVAGHADQMAVVQQIRAGIADMRQYPAAGDQRHGRDGGAHAGKTTLTLGFADDRVVRGHDGSRHHMGDDLHVAVNIVLFDVRQRPDGDGGGGVAAGMPPMPSQMAMRCSPANAESWLLERTVPTSETTVEYMNNCCEAVEVGKNVTSIRRWSHRCAQARARQESSARSDADD